MARRNRDGDGKDSLKFWMSIFIAVIMVSSIAGLALINSTGEDTLRYNQFKFHKDATYGYYVTKISGQDVNFYTFPTEAAIVNISNATMDKLKSAAFIVTTFDPVTSNQSTQAIELARFDLAKFMAGKSIYNAVLETAPGYEALPILSCDNASASTPVIVFNTSDYASVVDAGNCLYLNGQGLDFLKFRDKILYSYFGVI